MTAIRACGIARAAFAAVIVALVLTPGCQGENSSLTSGDGRRVIRAAAPAERVNSKTSGCMEGSHVI